MLPLVSFAEEGVTHLFELLDLINFRQHRHVHRRFCSGGVISIEYFLRVPASPLASQSIME
jgi:hypothetical protein